MSVVAEEWGDIARVRRIEHLRGLINALQVATDAHPADAVRLSELVEQIKDSLGSHFAAVEGKAGGPPQNPQHTRFLFELAVDVGYVRACARRAPRVVERLREWLSAYETGSRESYAHLPAGRSHSRPSRTV